LAPELLRRRIERSATSASGQPDHFIMLEPLNVAQDVIQRAAHELLEGGPVPHSCNIPNERVILRSIGFRVDPAS
jgi:hypothetical protein